MDENLKCIGHEQITSLGSAVSLTVPKGATYALLSAQTQNVRIRGDGTSPTATVGLLVAKDLSPIEIPLYGAAWKAIETTASAKLDVAYFG